MGNQYETILKLAGENNWYNIVGDLLSFNPDNLTQIDWTENYIYTKVDDKMLSSLATGLDKNENLISLRLKWNLLANNNNYMDSLVQLINTRHQSIRVSYKYIMNISPYHCPHHSIKRVVNL